MERDMEIVRRIALETAKLPMGDSLQALAGVHPHVFAAHAQWMDEARLVHAALSPKDSKAHAQHAMVWRLTWQGCEFADSIRDETLWAKAKETVIKPGLSFSFDVLREWLKTEITQGFPTLRT